MTTHTPTLVSVLRLRPAGIRAGTEICDDGPVGSFDPDLTDTVAAQRLDQFAQARVGVGHRAPADSRPRSLTTDTAFSSAAQSTPAVRSLGGNSGRVLFGVLLADFTSASSLLEPVGRHPHVSVPLVPGRVCRFAH
jgi:hypothetical protein